MKIVVIGGSGLIGTRLVRLLFEQGHDARPASPQTGVDTVTGEGLAEALAGADVVIDVTNSPDPDLALGFFEASTRNQLSAEAVAGVAHHVALSVVGTERLSESWYFRSKIAQEVLIEASRVPYSIVRTTQFFEFVDTLAASSVVDDVIRVAPALIQPIAADDVAAFVARAAIGGPLNRTVEFAGPEQFRLDELFQESLDARDDSRGIVVDPAARFFGAQLAERTLLPAAGTELSSTRYVDWLSQTAPSTT